MHFSLKKHSTWATLVVLSATILAIVSSWHDARIVDEIPHIGAGYSYLAKLDMRLNPEHPPLAKVLAALPLLAFNFNHNAFSSPAWTTDTNGQWNFGRELIYHSGVDAGLIGHIVVFPMMLFFVLSAWIMYRWADELWGPRAALLATFLFSFSPTVLAHARFVTTDGAALWGVLFASYYFVHYLKAPAKRSFWLAVVFFGLALLCKFSTILLVPLFVAAWLYHRPFSWKPLLVMIFGFLLVVWPAYTILTLGFPTNVQRAETVTLTSYSSHRTIGNTLVWMSDKPILRAAGHWGLGLLMVTERAGGGNYVYFDGTTYEKTAGHTYFPLVYLMKEPLPWLALLLIALVYSIKKSFEIRHSKLDIDVLIMLLWVLGYWAISIKSTLNIGVRHLLPVYPFMIMLVAGQVARLKNKGIWILLGWYFIENLLVFPHYLAYFNEFVGGPSGGYHYVVDSNLDWGQDLGRLATWVDKNHIKNIQLDYFGWADQYYYLGNNFVWLTSKQRPQAGWFAVSATYLMNHIHDDYAWLAGARPATVIGHSIFVYYLK